jgi:primosomal replication protein N
MGFRKYKRVG